MPNLVSKMLPKWGSKVRPRHHTTAGAHPSQTLPGMARLHIHPFFEAVFFLFCWPCFFGVLFLLEFRRLRVPGRRWAFSGRCKWVVFCRPGSPKGHSWETLPTPMCDLLMPRSVCERSPIHATRAPFSASPPPLFLESGSQNGAKIAGALFANRFFSSFCSFLSLFGVKKGL